MREIGVRSPVGIDLSRKKGSVSSTANRCECHGSSEMTIIKSRHEQYRNRRSSLLFINSIQERKHVICKCNYRRRAVDTCCLYTIYFKSINRVGFIKAFQSSFFSFKSRLIKHLRTPNYDYSLLFVCLLEVDRPTRGYFTHMEMLFRI